MGNIRDCLGRLGVGDGDGDGEKDEEAGVDGRDIEVGQTRAGRNNLLVLSPLLHSQLLLILRHAS